jgi:hypothetical protein
MAIMSSRVAVLLSALLLATGCQVTTDLGHSCFLPTKRLAFERDDNDDLVLDEKGKPIPIYVKDAQDNIVKDKDGNPIQEIQVVNIKEKDLVPGQDYIAFGATDCEDLVCIRDVESPPNPDYDPNSDNKVRRNAPAQGYCSRACLQGSDASACEVTEAKPVEGVKERMDCRSLLLDQASLDALRASDPEAYRSTFGDTNSPFFCAGKPTSTTTP